VQFFWLLFALLTARESVERLIEPVSIAFNQALLVAVVGLLVNGLSVLILRADAARTHHHELGGEGDEHHRHHEHDHQERVLKSRSRYGRQPVVAIVRPRSGGRRYDMS
jgi:hypothetical protein